jgi:hypothetical protein
MLKKIRHGLRADPAYRCWVNMRNRCNNPKATGYPHWGGRGIKVHPEWDNFKTFLDHIGPRPGPEYSIDRIDNDKDYCPGNVRWATAKQQVMNSSRYKGGRIYKSGNKYRIRYGAYDFGGVSSIKEAEELLEDYRNKQEDMC